MSLNCIRFVSTKDFLDRVLPVEHDTLEQIYAAVMASEVPTLYANEHWAGFPRGGEAGPFDREDLWTDYRARAPALKPDSAAVVRPSCALAMAPGVASAVGEDPSIPIEKKEAFWWMQVLAAVEAKRYPGQKDEEVISQLNVYLHSMVVEQSDRRFALGLLLSRAQVSVWCLDRSGLTGMDVPIHIHRDPKEFVRVLAALAILPAHHLGFDPTMKLAREPSPPIHTYRLLSRGQDVFDVEKYKKDGYTMQWVITTAEDTYLTLKVLHAPSTDGACGSSCTVWAVIRYADRFQAPDERPVLVLKQWWHPKGRIDEGAVYEDLQGISRASPDPDAQYIGEMHSHEAVQVEGEVDSTHRLGKRGQETELAPNELLRSGKRDRTTYEESARLFHVDFVRDEHGLFVVARYRAGRIARDLMWTRRTRMRLILKVFGCSVKFFASLRELLTVLSHGVRGHCFAYTHGVLHRDVSVGNLLILPIRDRDDSRPQTERIRGCLIDFGHAKSIRPISERVVPVSEEVDTDVLVTYNAFKEKEPKRVKVSEALVQRAVNIIRLRGIWMDRTVDPLQGALVVDAYISAAVRYHKTAGLTLSDGDVYTPEVFGWDTARLLGPLEEPKEFRFLLPWEREPVVATLPFASAQVLNESAGPIRYDMRGIRPTEALHDATHDMESFFWVLLYLSMMHSGPGSERRKELYGDLDDQPEQDREQVAELRRIVRCFFTGPLEVVAWNKKQLLKKGELFETLVLCHVHPYFEPLKPVLRRWWELLLLAYECEGYEYYNIHAYVIKLLEEALRDLPSDELIENAQRTRDTIKKREDLLRSVTHWHADSESQASPDEAQLAEPSSIPAKLEVTTNLGSPSGFRKEQVPDTRPLTPSSPSPKKAKYIAE